MLVGASGFVSVPLPPPWRLSRATVMPEVHTTVREGDRYWVASGETRHVVFDPERRVRADLVVTVAPGRPARRPLRPLAEATAGGPVEIGGHPGEYRLGRRRDGWLRRRTVAALRMRHYCPQTQRLIAVELSGAVSMDDLRTLLEALGHLRCHGPQAPLAPG
ncbi:MAG: hypothetical protein QN120_02275 [Armatimonadota bacterium]|nr:hypothetical protein [Armatimonadota bacterium]